MQDIIDLIVSNGIGVTCIVYFMFRDYRFMDSMNKTLQALNESVQLIETYFIKEGKGNDIRGSKDEVN